MEPWGVLFQKVVSSKRWLYRELNCFTWKLEEFCFRKWSPMSGDFTDSSTAFVSESGHQWAVTLQIVQLLYMEPWGVLFQKVVSKEWWLYRECWGVLFQKVVTNEQWLYRVGLPYMEPWGVLFQKVVTNEQWLYRVGLPYMEPWGVLFQKVVLGEWSHQDGLSSGAFSVRLMFAACLKLLFFFIVCFLALFICCGCRCFCLGSADF